MVSPLESKRQLLAPQPRLGSHRRSRRPGRSPCLVAWQSAPEQLLMPTPQLMPVPLPMPELPPGLMLLLGLMLTLALMLELVPKLQLKLKPRLVIRRLSQLMLEIGPIAQLVVVPLQLVVVLVELVLRLELVLRQFTMLELDQPVAHPEPTLKQLAHRQLGQLVVAHHRHKAFDLIAITTITPSSVH
jgi:hypothetical protein